MKYIGAHVSAGGGVESAPANAMAIGASAFALFTRNQRQWVSKPLTDESIVLFKERMLQGGFLPEMVLPHDSYLINLGHPEAEGLEKSRFAFLDEMKRCEQLGLCKLNFHPGSHLGKISEEECLVRIADSVNWVLERTAGVTAVIENTAGQGSNVGYRFEHLAAIIDRVEDKSRVAVCIDTCHTYTSGYDILDPEQYEACMRSLEEIIGLPYLQGIHLNDTKKDLGTRVDRHESIGKGFLAGGFFERFMNDARFDDMPIILETPDETLWQDEILMLHGMVR